jgi:DNA-binding NarL/FixJ family response regulator
VLRGAIQGKSNKVIARELKIAEGTVKAHLSAAYRILRVSNRTEAVYIAARYGVKSETANI